jgi:hypothetical protein
VGVEANVVAPKLTICFTRFSVVWAPPGMLSVPIFSSP